MVCKDLYFVSRNDGTTAFCPDLECHNANVLKYQMAPSRHPHAER
jgi:cell division protein YceG involved in septum cleavage